MKIPLPGQQKTKSGRMLEFRNSRWLGAQKAFKLHLPTKRANGLPICFHFQESMAAFTFGRFAILPRAATESAATNKGCLQSVKKQTKVVYAHVRQ